MYPLTSPYYTQQFGVSILYTKQYNTYIDIPVPLFSSSHPIYSTPSLSDTAGVVVGIVLGNPKNIRLLHGLPNFSVFLCQNMALMRVVIVNKGSLLGEISSKHLLNRVSSHGGSVLYDQSHSNEDIRQLRPNHHHTHLVVWPTTTLSSPSKDSLLRCQRRAKL